MTAKDVLRHLAEFGHMLVGVYVNDLSEADLLVRSVPGTNHMAWQLGHLIASTRHMLCQLGHSVAELPKGFEAAYTSETAASDDPAQFATKAEYLALAEQMKAATLAAIEATPEEALEQPSPEAMRDYAPTVAAVLVLVSNHWVMHAGQFVPIRRKLGKAPLF
jgi:uncharacterized damage-inducible protein DinB